MVCPFCITSALIANAPIITGALGAGLAVKRKLKKKEQQIKVKTLKPKKSKDTGF